MNDEFLGKKLWILLWAMGLGALSYLARVLTNGSKVTIRTFVGGALASVISCFIVGAIFIEWFQISPLITLVTGGLVGHIGGPILTIVAVWFMKRFGIEIKEDDIDVRKPNIPN